ncbi:hybrid sensor histidine kinase/response regulator [Spirochaeta cellobiosiphila]|uniref:hybrid sensor histidine kinase/response regulator n=1 Tax=Spirochaeta cellobiosiphila TaxID=504483 RepID=UPI0004182667|nr:response regulator [Spirochaeta cellobiosiphila]
MIQVLAVDDDEVSLALIRKAMETKGYNVDTYLQGRHAINALEHTNYDVIISDLMMPDMDGELFLQEARKYSPTTPFIFLTAKKSTKTAVKVLKMGADDYLEKPLKGAELLEDVDRILKRKMEENFIRKNHEEYIMDQYDKLGLFSWKDLYRSKDVTQTNRIMGILSRNMGQGGGFYWLDMLKEEINNQDQSFDELIVSKKVLELVVESADYMKKIINDLDAISRLAHEDIQVKSYPLDEVTKGIEQYFKDELFPILAEHQRSISLNPLKLGQSHTLAVNRESLATIFKELLCNAIKYSPEDGKILFLSNIRHEGSESYVEYSFWNPPKNTVTRDDNGQAIYGIPYEYSEAVFELFYTFESFPVKIPEEEWSQGAGLFVVKQMVQKMGGDVRARNMIMHLPEGKVPYVRVTLLFPLS